MKRLFVNAGVSVGLALSLQACMRPNEGAPSYLGMAIAAEEPTDRVAGSEPSAELRHVTSNKVLGAMAFQKTTGRAIDPARLQGRR